MLGKCRKKTRRRYDRDLKISVISELEAGKPLAQIANRASIPVFLADGRPYVIGMVSISPLFTAITSRAPRQLFGSS
jgi:hypothetical protein